MGLRCQLGLFLVLLLAPHSNAKAGQKSVLVSLDSKWAHTSLIAETCEFLAKEGNQVFWDFVASWIENVTPEQLKEYTDEQLHAQLVKLAESLISGARLDLLKFSLALRALSPAVEMHRQIASTYETDCPAFVDLHGKVICKSEELEKEIGAADNECVSPARVFGFDHHYPGSRGVTTRAVLYGNVGREEWLKMHRIMIRKAKERKINYVMRHADTEKSGKKVRLSGYGVELAIKSTEYKAQDDSKIKANVTEGGAVVEEEEEEDLNGFNFKLLKEQHPELKDSLQEFKLHLLEADELTPLKVWQLQDLSFQAAQKALAADKHDALGVLQDISQNFPLMARSLTRTVVKSDVRREIEANQGKYEDLGISAGESAMFVNGLLVDMDSLDVYQLLDLLKQEEKLSAGFFRMGFRREYLALLMNLDLQDDAPAYAIDYREGFPEYINDLDRDPEYRDWGNSVKLMTQPYFPGMIRPIARNFYTLIFIVDPATRQGRNLLKIAYSFYAHQIPIRIGIMFAVNTDRLVSGEHDAGVALLNAYNFVKSDKKAAKALRFLTDIIDDMQDRDQLAADDVIKAFKKKYPDEDEEIVFGSDSDYDKGRQAGSEFLTKSGIGKAPKVLLNGVPLDDSGIGADRFEETVINEVMRVTPKLQRAIMAGKLTDDKTVMNYILDQPEVMPRLNARILESEKEKDGKRSKYLDFTDVFEYKADTLAEFKRLNQRQKSQLMIQKMKYIQRNYELGIRPVTVWVVADLETKEGRELYYNAIRQMKHSHKTRIGVIHNPTNPDQPASESKIARLVHGALKILPAWQAKSLVTKLVKEENVAAIRKGTTTIEDLEVHEMNTAMFKKEFALLPDDFLSIHSFYATRVLELQPGQRALVANGQVIGPLEDAESFESEDFGLLERYVLARHAQVVADQVKQWDVEDEFGKSSDLVARVSSLVMNDPVKKRRHWVMFDDDKHSVITITAMDETTAAFDVVAIIDPLSRDAQKLAPLLSVLNNVINADIKVAMNPKPKLSEMPIKSFYRLVLDSSLQFGSDGSLRLGPVAKFSSLPQKQLLTLNVQPPEAWLVEAVRALYDLDNIKMENVDTDITAEFELEHLLLEGHCFDEITGNPPRGLQFTLGTERNPVMVDTIVMANLGYFQLKANPGAWLLRLRSGRSAEIYDITTHQNTDSSFYEPDVTAILDSFTGKIIRMRVAKKPEKIEESLLGDAKDEEEESGGIWKSISSKLGGGGSKGTYDTINVFSLASGHLYERFMRIMILSVMKKAKHPVKFWLLKNYLSPQFKKVLPYLAEHYGFAYELVQYKWPRWLHQQKEKQRIMWGYKLLFLDVLFPLDVRKIIFVDADQVVRTDLMELMELNLEGAPYGYTPFCDSRTDMDGFRFWKSGYWANHLAGRKYHISALYVVDLKKFRQIAAGDRLRGQYQGLSADPNSLSNLDQDLPNNMIHQVRIKSLPQEWLWCETWCDDYSKRYAKTIDLCNNPQTKEPKLESARRIITEWDDYDKEIKGVMEKYDRGEPAQPPTTEAPPEGKKDEHTEF